MSKISEFEQLTNKALVSDLTRWLSTQPRPYDEVMEAWRTSCPRLTIWEDACDHGFVERYTDQGTLMVRATRKGLSFVKQASNI